jgi:hypothetical protein
LNGKATQPSTPPLVSKEAKMPGTPPLPKKKRTNKKLKSKRIVKKKEERMVIGRMGKVARKIPRSRSRKKREIKTIADFLKKVLPTSTFEQKVLPKNGSLHTGSQTVRRSLLKTRSPLHEAPHIDLTPSLSTSTTSDVIFETTTPPGTSKRGDADIEEIEEDDYNHIQKEVLDFGTKNFGVLASPYTSPHVYKRSFLDTTYGIRQICDTFMIADLPVDVDENINIHIKKQEFPATKGLERG